MVFQDQALNAEVKVKDFLFHIWLFETKVRIFVPINTFTQLLFLIEITF